MVLRGGMNMFKDFHVCSCAKSPVQNLEVLTLSLNFLTSLGDGGVADYIRFVNQNIEGRTFGFDCRNL